jgi:predicted Zn finger-like uncharacterized protein
MSDQAFTRCPGCATVFRVSAAQLALREGQVRCGHCRAVFDANDHRVAFGTAHGEDVGIPDELAAGRPTVTLRNAEALQPIEAQPGVTTAPLPDAARSVDGAADLGANLREQPDAQTDEPEAGQSPQADGAAHTKAAAEAPPDDIEALPAQQDPALRAERFEWRPRKPLRERPRMLYGAALVLLVVALGAQALLEYRDALAAHLPFTRPILQAACDVVGCTVGPLREAAALSIDASDLQADPAHKGLLKLTATIRNRASYPIAWPYVELTLTDASDRIVARRAFAPAEYAGSIASPDRGIAGNGEDLVTLFLDASATSQAGYRLYLFYP